MKLTKEEQETIIRYDQADGRAIIDTYDRTLIRRLDNLILTHEEDIKLVAASDGCATYTVPKRWIKVIAPRKMSEEDKEKLRERVAKAREVRNA